MAHYDEHVYLGSMWWSSWRAEIPHGLWWHNHSCSTSGSGKTGREEDAVVQSGLHLFQSGMEGASTSLEEVRAIVARDVLLHSTPWAASLARAPAETKAILCWPWGRVGDITSSVHPPKLQWVRLMQGVVTYTSPWASMNLTCCIRVPFITRTCCTTSYICVCIMVGKTKLKLKKKNCCSSLLKDVAIAVFGSVLIKGSCDGITSHNLL